MVNTAEAMFVLRCARVFPQKIYEGRIFLEQNVFRHVERLGPRIRYVAFTLLELCHHREASNEDLIKQSCDWLLNARNPDNGWGQEASAEPSELFPTFLAIWALKSAGWPAKRLDPSLQWVIAQAQDVGWPLQPGQGPSPVATAYALLALSSTTYTDHDRVRAGKHYLLQTRLWGMEEEVIAGTVWKHCTFAWVIPALLHFEENPYAPVIAEGIRHINTLRSRAGGWNETENDKGRTIRAQYWSVFALESVYRHFDPAIHVLRIDAERAQDVLTEPGFVKIAVHSRWATILPASIYKGAVYVLLVAAPLFLLGLYRALGSAPQPFDALLCLGSLSGAWLLIRKRHRYFPRVAGVFRIVLAALATLSLLFGWNARALVTIARDYLAKLLHIAS